MTRTKAILSVLARGREPKLAESVMRVFGASSLEECLATYEAVGAAERASIDAVIARLMKDASAAFELSVDAEEKR